MSWTVAAGRPVDSTALKACSASRRVVLGWSGWAFAMTGLPAAIAAAKSPPLTPLKAKGKLLGPKMTTGPMGAKQERIYFSRSRVAWRQDSSRNAAAAWGRWVGGGGGF